MNHITFVSSCSFWLSTNDTNDCATWSLKYYLVALLVVLTPQGPFSVCKIAHSEVSWKQNATSSGRNSFCWGVLSSIIAFKHTRVVASLVRRTFSGLKKKQVLLIAFCLINKILQIALIAFNEDSL